MTTMGAPFSGQIGFVATEMRWPTTHMVAPKEKAVGCVECHSTNGRLQKVSGLYLPGRDSNKVLNVLGWTAALLTLIGVLIHGHCASALPAKGAKTMAERIYIFKRFERFWHWSQAALIITLMLTGFEVHGSYKLFGFETAVNVHTIAAWSLVTLWVFAVFWHFTTGEWKQYIPTLDKVDAMIKYYLTGIFTTPSIRSARPRCPSTTRCSGSPTCSSGRWSRR